MSSIQKSSFSTHQLPHADRFNAWRESISSIFDVKLDPLTANDSFDARLDSHLIDDQLMLSRCKTMSQTFERSGRRTAIDGLDYYLVQTHLSGSQEARRGSKANRSAPGDLLVIDLADIHSAQTDDFEHLTVIVPRHMLAPMLNHPDSQEGRVISADAPLTRLAVNHIQTLGRVISEIGDEDATEIIEPTVSLIAAALNGSVATVENGARAAASSILTRAKLHIEQNLHRPDLSSDSVCRMMQMSRASMYKLFEPYGGIRSYIQDRRLRRAATDLSNVRNMCRPIYDIAFDLGFRSEAHFSRAFKRRFNATPREFRRASDPLHVRRNTIPLDRVGDRNYEKWLGETLRS